MTGTEVRDLAFSHPQPVIETHKKGTRWVYLVLDPVIAQKLGIDEESCRFSQAIGDSGEIILKLHRRGAPQ